MSRTSAQRPTDVLSRGPMVDVLGLLWGARAAAGYKWVHGLGPNKSLFTNPGSKADLARGGRRTTLAFQGNSLELGIVWPFLKTVTYSGQCLAHCWLIHEKPYKPELWQM